MKTIYQIVDIDLPSGRAEPIGNMSFQWVSPIIHVGTVQKSGAKIYYRPGNHDFATFPSTQSGAVDKEPRFFASYSEAYRSEDW